MAQRSVGSGWRNDGSGRRRDAHARRSDHGSGVGLADHGGRRTRRGNTGRNICGGAAHRHCRWLGRDGRHGRGGRPAAETDAVDADGARRRFGLRWLAGDGLGVAALLVRDGIDLTFGA